MTPLFNTSGTTSKSRTAFRIFINHVITTSPPAFRCSAISPPGSGGFLLFSLLTAPDTSSSVKGTSSRNSSFLQDYTSKSRILSFQEIISGVSPNFDSLHFQKCSAHTFGNVSGSCTVSTPTISLEHLDFLGCGVLNLLLFWATNNLSLFCTPNLSDLTAHDRTLSPQPSAIYSSLQIASPLQDSLHLSKLHRLADSTHRRLKMSSLHFVFLLSCTQGSTFLAISISSLATCSILLLITSPSSCTLVSRV